MKSHLYLFLLTNSGYWLHKREPVALDSRLRLAKPTPFPKTGLKPSLKNK